MQTVNNLIPFDISYVVADWASPSLYRFTPPGTAGINLLEGVYRHSDNLQNWTMNLARELTNNMAIVTPATQTDQYDGEVFSPKIYFKIRWCKYPAATCWLLPLTEYGLRLAITSRCRLGFVIRLPSCHNHGDATKTCSSVEGEHDGNGFCGYGRQC